MTETTSQPGNLSQRMSGHFKPDELRSIDVPEWSLPEDGSPFVLFYRPATVDDIDRMASLDAELPASQRRGTYGRAAWLIVRKARDAAGAPLFTAEQSAEDERELRRVADPGVLLKIATQMLIGSSASIAEPADPLEGAADE